MCDIQQQDQIDAMVAQTVERFGRVDGLINNAQTFRPLSPIAEVSESDVDVFYDSGVKGTLWAMQAVYPHMKAQGWGRIVNFASSMGITGGTGFARVQRVEGGDPRARRVPRRASGRSTASS